MPMFISTNRIRYRIGHPAYGGSNRATYCATVKDVEKEMAARKVPRKAVRNAIQELRVARLSNYGEQVGCILLNKNNAQVELFLMPAKRKGG